MVLIALNFSIIVLLFINNDFLFTEENLDYNQTNNKQVNSLHNDSCLNYKKITVNGNSMRGVFNHGDEIVYSPNWYNCTSTTISRNDIIIFKNPSNSDSLLVKRVVSVPFDYVEIDYKRRNIIVNNETISLLNSNQPYQFEQMNILQYYVDSYDGIIPKDSYLVLGNINRGTLDSTKFGLIPKDSIIGKVILK